MVVGGPDATAASSRTPAQSGVFERQSAPEPPGESRGGTNVTAEIPAVPVAKSYGVLLPDGSIWYPGSKRKLPAPLFLRLIVWTLTFLVAIGLAGLLVMRLNPSWVDPLRRTAAAGTGTSPSGSTPGSGSTPANSLMQQTSSTPSSVTYSVPTSPSTPYIITISTQERCYVIVVVQPSGQQLLNTVIPASSSKPLWVTGTATVSAAAGGASLSVRVTGGRTVGTVPLLKDFPYPFIYKFVPNQTS